MALVNSSPLLGAIDTLEISFRQIKHDLASATHRLDTAFDESSARSGAPHPLKLAQRLAALEDLASKLQGDWGKIQEKRSVLLPTV